MKSILMIIVLGLLLSGCTSYSTGMTSNENMAVVEMGVVDALKKTPADNLPVAQKWCSQFNKKAKFLKSGLQRYYYSCN